METKTVSTSSHSKNEPRRAGIAYIFTIPAASNKNISGPSLGNEAETNVPKPPLVQKHSRTAWLHLYCTLFARPVNTIIRILCSNVSAMAAF